MVARADRRDATRRTVGDVGRELAEALERRDHLKVDCEREFGKVFMAQRAGNEAKGALRKAERLEREYDAEVTRVDELTVERRQLMADSLDSLLGREMAPEEFEGMALLVRFIWGDDDALSAYLTEGSLSDSGLPVSAWLASGVEAALEARRDEVADGGQRHRAKTKGKVADQPPAPAVSDGESEAPLAADDIADDDVSGEDMISGFGLMDAADER